MMTRRVERNETTVYGYRTTKVMHVLNEFSRSDSELVKVIYQPWEYVSALSCATSMRQSIRRFGYNFKARLINGEVYLDKRV